MRLLSTLAIGALAVAVLAACGGQDDAGAGAPQPSLAGTSWTLTEVAVAGAMTAAVDASGSLNFEADGTMYGSTGCNRFMGKWALEGEALELTTGGSTMMACPEGLQAQETAVLEALSATGGYSVAAGLLSLKDADGTALASYTEATTDLANTSWTATGVNNGSGAVVSNSATPGLTLEFAADGSVGGFAGCTAFTGSFTTDAAGIALTDLAPAAGCDDTSLAADQAAYLAALAAATNFGIDGTRLDLRDEGGALQVGFTASS